MTPSDSLPLIAGSIETSWALAGLWYGGVSILALVMIGLTLRIARNSEVKHLGAQLKTLGDELTEIKTAKEDLEKSFRSELYKSKELRKERDLAVEEIEDSLKRNHLLATELRTTREYLQKRDEELQLRRLNTNNSTTPLTDEAPQTYDAVNNALLESLNNRIYDLESKLAEKNDRLLTRDRDFEALQSEIVSLKQQSIEKTSSEAHQKLELQRDHEIRTDLLAAKDAAAVEVEERFRQRIHHLETQLTEKLGLLDRRNGELEVLGSELDAVNARLTETESARSQAENLLRAEIAKNTDALQGKDSIVQALHKEFNRKIHALENQLRENQESLTLRDKEVKTLDTEVQVLTKKLTESSFLKDRAERYLSEALKTTSGLPSSKPVPTSSEQLLRRQIDTLETQLGGKQEVLNHREAELQALKSELNSLIARLTESDSARVKAENLLRDVSAKSAEVLQGKDSILHTLQAESKQKIYALENQLRESHALLKDSEAELDALRSRVTFLTRQTTERASVEAQATSELEQELKKRIDSLHAKDSIIKELEEQLRRGLPNLESQLSEKREQLQQRDGELRALKAEVIKLNATVAETETVKAKLEKLLHDEIAKNTEALHGQGAIAQALHEESNRRINALERQLREGQDLLKDSEAELDGLKSRVTSLTRQLTERASVETRATTELEQELKKKTDALLAVDSTIKKLEDSLRKEIHHLETQLDGKQEVLNHREAELQTLKSELSVLVARLTESDSARVKAENLLRDVTVKNAEFLQGKESIVQTLQEESSRTIFALENQLRENQEALKGRETELKALRSEVDTLNARLTLMQTTKIQTEHSLQERLKEMAGASQVNGSAATVPDDTSGESITALEKQLSELQILLETRDKQIEKLTLDLKETKILFAAEEAKVWQSIGRQNAWKNRLAKIGIPLKRN